MYRFWLLSRLFETRDEGGRQGSLCWATEITVYLNLNWHGKHLMRKNDNSNVP